MKVRVSLSTKPDKRLKAEFASKTVHFGARGGSTFVDHKDSKVKKNWEARHRVRENWQDYDSAGAMAKHILWNKTSIKESIKDLNTRQKAYKFTYKGK